MDLQLPAEHDTDAWQVSIWNLPDEVVSRPQKLQLMLMLEAAFNAFDPFVVVGDLLRQRDLWEGVVMDRGFQLPEGEGKTWYRMATDLIKLRDVAGTHWNVDTLFLLTAKTHAGPLQKLAQGWSADDVRFIEGPDVSTLLGVYPAEGHQILTVWWD